MSRTREEITAKQEQIHLAYDQVNIAVADVKCTVTICFICKPHLSRATWVQWNALKLSPDKVLLSGMILK